MQQFVKLYQNIIPKQLVSELYLPPIFFIPWGHNIYLMQKINNIKQRLWYAKKTIENGWSRVMLVHHIETKLYERQAIEDKKTHNFQLALPDIQSDLASQLIKDEYNFDFLTITDKDKERKLENALINDIVLFILELGVGFSFVGKQY
jgi:predicted nuclease of restriction endonuclease-like (RecB) superfamily